MYLKTKNNQNIMKKTAIIFVFLFTLGILASSCRSTKPPCPAYSSVEITTDLQVN